MIQYTDLRGQITTLLLVFQDSPVIEKNHFSQPPADIRRYLGADQTNRLALGADYQSYVDFSIYKEISLVMKVVKEFPVRNLDLSDNYY